MGYTERHCQLCGISFNVGRIRTADEPIEAAFDGCGLGWTPVDHYISGCEAEGCFGLKRILAEHVYHDGSLSKAREVEEHIAGPQCMADKGYSGHRISGSLALTTCAHFSRSKRWRYFHQKCPVCGVIAELILQGCRQVQCILHKGENWTQEPDDEDFVIKSPYCFLTGISRDPPEEFEVVELTPVRHGVQETYVQNGGNPDPQWGTPMHPWCFAIFKRLSMGYLGKVDIDGLRCLWSEEEKYPYRFNPQSLDSLLVDQQFYACIPGTEYLVADPLNVPGLDELIEDCLFPPGEQTDVVFDAGRGKQIAHDPFASLPPELKKMIISPLSPRNVANLRVASRSFQQLPQRYFEELIKDPDMGMPWVWEMESLSSKQVDWHRLWCSLCAADGGSGYDEKERYWMSRIRWASIDFDTLLDGVSPKLREEFDLQPLSPSQRYPTEYQESQMAAVFEARKAAGNQWPMKTELKSLRNRRRIDNDVYKIVRMIEALYEKE